MKKYSCIFVGSGQFVLASVPLSEGTVKLEVVKPAKNAVWWELGPEPSVLKGIKLEKQNCHILPSGKEVLVFSLWPYLTKLVHITLGSRSIGPKPVNEVL